MRKNVTAKELEKIIRYNIPKRYPLGDNLYLDISGGSAVFSFRYKINGKQHKKSLKPFHKVHNTLAHARANALHLKAKVRQGIDPKEEELRARREADEKLAAQQLIDQKRQSTFQILANATIAYLEHEWTNPKTRPQWESVMNFME
ncbi:MAG: Arm DNA-binding domain-containing protein, partial [Porticoccaceae bacterium]|nr:Arm DNA-binding domain-containing protein [Porticoccaceae bacterium]